MGASKKPIIGKINVANGAVDQPVITALPALLANGIATITSKPAIIKQVTSTSNQFIFLSRIPARNLPIAVDAARILAI